MAVTILALVRLRATPTAGLITDGLGKYRILALSEPTQTPCEAELAVLGRSAPHCTAPTAVGRSTDERPDRVVSRVPGRTAHGNRVPWQSGGARKTNLPLDHLITFPTGWSLLDDSCLSFSVIHLPLGCKHISETDFVVSILSFRTSLLTVERRRHHDGLTDVHSLPVQPSLKCTYIPCAGQHTQHTLCL